MQDKLARGVKVKRSKTRPWCVHLPTVSAGLTTNIYFVYWAHTIHNETPLKTFVDKLNKLNSLSKKPKHIILELTFPILQKHFT